MQQLFSFGRPEGRMETGGPDLESQPLPEKNTQSRWRSFWRLAK